MDHCLIFIFFGFTVYSFAYRSQLNVLIIDAEIWKMYRKWKIEVTWFPSDLQMFLEIISAKEPQYHGFFKPATLSTFSK